MGQERLFAGLLSRVAQEITARQAVEVCCGELTLEQFRTLEAATASDRPAVGTLAASLRVDVSTMSRNVTVLERSGYLSRARSEQDGRVVHVALTAKGRRALETLRCDEQSVLANIYSRLPASDRPKVVRALEVLASCLEGARSLSTTDGCCAPGPLRRERS